MAKEPCTALIPRKTLRDEFVNLAFLLIRASPVLGKDTCSSMDECFSDKELREELFRTYTENYGEDTPGEDFCLSLNPVEHLVWLMHLEDIFWERQGISGKFCMRVLGHEPPAHTTVDYENTEFYW